MRVFARCFSFRAQRKINGVTLVNTKDQALFALQVLDHWKHKVHAWDTRVAQLPTKGRPRTPIAYGRLICASCYLGPEVNFGNGSRLMIDNDTPERLILLFKPYFEDASWRKVFHNYAFDHHVLSREGIQVKGFMADTWQLSRLVDSSLASWEFKAATNDQVEFSEDPITFVEREGSEEILRKQRMQMRNFGTDRAANRSSSLENFPVTSTPQQFFPFMAHPPGCLDATITATSSPRPLFPIVATTSTLSTDCGVRPPLSSPDVTATPQSLTPLAGQSHPMAPKKKTKVNHGGYELKNVVEQFSIRDEHQAQVAPINVKELLKKNKTADVADLHNSEGAFDNWAAAVTNEPLCTFLLFEHLKNRLDAQEWHTEVHQDATARGSREKPFESAAMYTGKTMWSFVEEYYKDFAKILCEIEAEGLPVDSDFLKQSETAATTAYEEHMEHVRQWAGQTNPSIEHLNIRSVRQVRQLLFGCDYDPWAAPGNTGAVMNTKTSEIIPPIGYFDITDSVEGLKKRKRKNGKTPEFPIVGMGLRPAKGDEFFTSNGWPSVNRASLAKMEYLVAEDETLSEEKRSDTIKGLQNLRNAIRARFMLTSYILPLQDLAVKHNGRMRVYPTLMMDTSTGRLVCRVPNLQSMPSNSDPFKLRKAFRAAPGRVILACDYSQLELRIIADRANCTSMINKILGGGDFHSEVAADMFPEIREWVNRTGGSIKDQFPTERRIAKTLNFGIAYGISAYRIASELNLPFEEAKDMVNRWYADKKEIKIWKDKIVKNAQETMKVPSLLGRNRTLPLVHRTGKYREKSMRAAVNHCVQGSAADICMAAMIRIRRNKRLRDLGFRMILQVHDEIVLEGPREGADEALSLVKTCMEDPFADMSPGFTMRVPLQVDGAAGDTWFDAKNG